MVTRLLVRAYGEHFVVVCHNDQDYHSVLNYLHREWLCFREINNNHHLLEISAQEWLAM